MRRKLEKQTRGFRAWRDQVDSVERMIELNPELGWAQVVRRGLDLVIGEQKENERPPPTDASIR
jgi:hypothetical protein